MGVSVTRLGNTQVVVVRFGGTLTAQSWQEADTLLERMDLDLTPLRVLYDLTKVKEFDLSFMQLHRHVASRQCFFGDCTKVFIAVWAEKDLTFGLARMFVTLLEQFDNVCADAFRNRELATGFLATPPATVEERGWGRTA